MIDFSSLQTSYSGKRVLVTGHTGFKGSWLIVWLSQLGAEVKSIALEPLGQEDLFIQINGSGICESIIHDIRDAAFIKQQILDFKPDFIFHLAAQAIVWYSYDHPLETISTNVSGTANILDALRYLEKPCTSILVTTDKVYDNDNSEQRFEESDRLGGKDPYSASKSATEIIIESYRHSFFPQEKLEQHGQVICAARAGNVIGGGDRAENRIVPDLIKALENKVALTIRNPNSVRPWQHVLEPLGGYLLYAAKSASQGKGYAEALNFGPKEGDILSVKELVETAFSFWGSGSYETPDQINAPYEASFLQLDIERAKRTIEWEPKYTSKEAIIKTMDWYKNAPNDCLNYTEKQIKEYVSQ